MGEPGWPEPKRWGDYWVLLNSHFNEESYCFYKLLLHREHLVRKSMPSITCNREAQLKLTLCYVSFKTGTEKQEKHMVSITFLFTSEGHKAIWKSWILFFWTSGFLTRPDTRSHRQGLVLRLLPQFLGAFSQGQMPTDTGKAPLLAPTLK
jgi:hypothetical protein